MAELEFEGEAPDAGELSRTWRAMLDEADRIVGLLPAEHVGTCVVEEDGELFRGSPRELEGPGAAPRLSFRAGSIRGAFPVIRSDRQLSRPLTAAPAG